MKVSQIKLRGLGTLPETDWITLDPQLTTIHGQNPAGYTGFFRAIEAINPPYDCKTAQPFADFPRIMEHNGYTKVISPRKRTVIISIFEASAAVVHTLAGISSLFYETDKIEIGRRLDYSRWINFIELPSSTRWSEISTDILSLLEKGNNPENSARIKQLTETLRASDRIKGPLMESLDGWLHRLIADVPEDEQLLSPLLVKVNRGQYFKKARTLLNALLPLCVRIDAGEDGSSRSSSALPHLLEIYKQKISSLETRTDRQDLQFMERVNSELRNLPFLQPEIHFCSAQDMAKLIINYNGRTYENVTLLDNLLQLQITSALAVVLSRILYKSDPLLIFDNNDHKTGPEVHYSLVNQIEKIADHCQSLFGTGNNKRFRQEYDGIQYALGDIIKDGVRAR